MNSLEILNQCGKRRNSIDNRELSLKLVNLIYNKIDSSPRQVLTYEEVEFIWTAYLKSVNKNELTIDNYVLVEFLQFYLKSLKLIVKWCQENHINDVYALRNDDCDLIWNYISK